MSTDRYGVMGYPIKHSRSPVIHHLFARQTAQQIEYNPMEVSSRSTGKSGAPVSTRGRQGSQCDRAAQE